ncbi:hypothetical protein [Longimicrobium sp.]|uniref:hypothetical protein n=1 Tax=Longimicrobium sp. TaxID=2029185 RepID=UPI003B3AD4EA
MKKPSLDRTLKLLWLLIGALLLLFLAAGGVMILSQVIGNAGAGDAAVQIASEDRAPREEPRAVRYPAPQAIRGTSTRLIPVEYGRAYQPDGGGYASGARYTSEVVANVIFLDAQGARLLLDRPAHVASIHYPRTAQDVQRWIAYQIAFDDTNGDARLDRRDATTLYVTDVEGRSLRPVLRPPLRLRSFHALDAGRMLVYALEPPRGAAVDEDRMGQRAFIYDVASGQLAPYAALDSAAERAGQILRR